MFWQFKVKTLLPLGEQRFSLWKLVNFALTNRNPKMFARLDALGAEFKPRTVGEARPLEIRLFAGFARRIKFGGADAVGVTARDLAGFAAS